MASSVPERDGDLEATEIADLERYLDATKSNLLFARRVMLVEGPAELFLIPALLKKVMNIDLEREGISVIPIYGVHFDVYAKLFSQDCLPKKCAIIADGDLKPSDANENLEGEDDLPEAPELVDLENEQVKVFACATTFERAVTFEGTLEMFAGAADDVGAPRVATRLREGLAFIKDEGNDAKERSSTLEEMRTLVLNTAKRFGKARFAQLAARHVADAYQAPKYIVDAVKWLTEA